MPWYYLSFAEGQWLGCVTVEADDEIEAVRKSHRIGCNPGGSVLVVTVPEGFTPPASTVDRLITDKEELEKHLGPLALVRR